jgi:hypothetical protein
VILHAVPDPFVLQRVSPLRPSKGNPLRVAAFALVIFVVCFTPFPIQTFFGR